MLAVSINIAKALTGAVAAFCSTLIGSEVGGHLTGTSWIAAVGAAAVTLGAVYSAPRPTK